MRAQKFDLFYRLSFVVLLKPETFPNVSKLLLKLTLHIVH